MQEKYELTWLAMKLVYTYKMEFQLPINEVLKVQKNFSQLLNEHHLSGLFYQFFNNSQLPIECQQQYKKQWIHNSLILEEIAEINVVALKYNTTSAMLKGAHLLGEIYTDLGSRFLSDLDLLINPNDKVNFEKVLYECGYVNRFEEKFHGNHFKSDWFKLVGLVEINLELHTQLFFHLDQEHWDLKPSYLSQFYKLSDEDLVIHLCGHLAFQHNFLKLFWLFDLYFLLNQKKDKLNWAIIKSKSKDKQLYRSIQMCLWALSQYYGLSLGQYIEDLFKLKNKHWWQKYLTLDFLVYPHKNKKNYFIIKHATKDQLRTALYYNLTWFYHYKIEKFWSK